MKGNRIIAYSAALVALGIGLGYALAWLPNVELVSFTAALSGFVLGRTWGIIDGALIFGIYSALSPFGMAPLPLLLAQIIGGAFIGFLGALLRKKLNKAYFAAIIGILGTAFYDIITNAAGFVAFPTKQAFLAYIVAGLSFSIVHIVSNAVIFAILFPVISKGDLTKKFIARK